MLTNTFQPGWNRLDKINPEFAWKWVGWLPTVQGINISHPTGKGKTSTQKCRAKRGYCWWFRNLVKMWLILIVGKIVIVDAPPFGWVYKSLYLNNGMFNYQPQLVSWVFRISGCHQPSRSWWRLETNAIAWGRRFRRVQWRDTKGKKVAKRTGILESEPIKTRGVLQLKCFYNVAGCLDMIPSFLEGCKRDIFVQVFAVLFVGRHLSHGRMVPNR